MDEITEQENHKCQNLIFIRYGDKQKLKPDLLNISEFKE